MSSLPEILLTPDQRHSATIDVVALLERYVADRAGLRGMTYRTGLAMLQKARPGMVDRAAAKLLPAFLDALDPLYQQFRQRGSGTFSSFVGQHRETAVDALLSVADERVRQASDFAQKTYARFRGSAEDEAAQLLPQFLKLIEARLPGG